MGENSVNSLKSFHNLLVFIEVKTWVAISDTYLLVDARRIPFGPIIAPENQFTQQLFRQLLEWWINETGHIHVYSYRTDTDKDGKTYEYLYQYDIDPVTREEHGSQFSRTPEGYLLRNESPLRYPGYSMHLADSAANYYPSMPDCPIDKNAERDVPMLGGPGVPEPIDAIDLTPPEVAGGVCLPGDQAVQLAGGIQKTIPELVVGDVVVVPDEHDPDGPKQECRIVEIYHNAPQAILTLKFKTPDGTNFSVRSTEGHRYYVRNLGWQHASDMEIGSECLNFRNESMTLLSKELDPESVPVYNFQVEGAHTYFVGDSEKLCVLTHNQDCELNALPDWNRQNKESDFVWAKRVLDDSINSEWEKHKRTTMIRDQQFFAESRYIFVQAVANALLSGVPEKAILQALEGNRNYNVMRAGLSCVRYHLGDVLTDRLGYANDPNGILESAKHGIKNAIKKLQADNPKFKDVVVTESTPLPSVIYDAMKEAGGAAALRDLLTNPKYSNIIIYVGPSDKHSPPPKKIKIR